MHYSVGNQTPQNRTKGSRWFACGLHQPLNRTRFKWIESRDELLLRRREFFVFCRPGMRPFRNRIWPVTKPFDESVC